MPDRDPIIVVKKVKNQHILNGRTEFQELTEAEGRTDPNYRKALPLRSSTLRVRPT